MPTTSWSRAPSLRGGPRANQGARLGNLNALKHGRYSRFKDALPPAPFDPAVVARSVLVKQRTEAERLAAAFLRVILAARHKREVADAVAERRPLPSLPLVTASRRDRTRVLDFLQGATTLTRIEQAGLDGRVEPDGAGIAALREEAARIERILPTVAHLLDRAARPPVSPESLAAFLRNEGGNEQTLPAPVESTASALAALAESGDAKTRKTIRANIPSPAEPPAAAESAASLLAEARAFLAAHTPAPVASAPTPSAAEPAPAPPARPPRAHATHPRAGPGM